ncbi:hypothetical protein ABVT39_018472 [Epinephelus coioides]
MENSIRVDVPDAFLSYSALPEVVLSDPEEIAATLVLLVLCLPIGQLGSIRYPLSSLAMTMLAIFLHLCCLGGLGLVFRDPHNSVVLWISGAHTLLYRDIVTIHREDSPAKTVKSHVYSPGKTAQDAEDKSRLYRRPSCEGMTANMACPLNYSPVCGSNGITYSNECSLCVFRLEKNADILIVAEGPC